MTINVVNILVKNCPLRTLEMAFQQIKISNFSGGAWPQISSGSSPLQHSPETLVIEISWFYLHVLKRLDSMTVPKPCIKLKHIELANISYIIVLNQQFSWNFTIDFFYGFSVNYRYCDCVNQPSNANILRDVTSHLSSIKCVCCF